jgi:hypothetical protein
MLTLYCVLLADVTEWSTYAASLATPEASGPFGPVSVYMRTFTTGPHISWNIDNIHQLTPVHKISHVG